MLSFSDEVEKAAIINKWRPLLKNITVKEAVYVAGSIMGLLVIEGKVSYELVEQIREEIKNK